MRMILFLTMLFVLAPLSACADADDNTVNTDGNGATDSGLESSHKSAGPRLAEPGEEAVADHTNLPLKFKHLAKQSVGSFQGRCTVEEIIADSGWQGYEEELVEKEVHYFVACNKK